MVDALIIAPVKLEEAEYDKAAQQAYAENENPDTKAQMAALGPRLLDEFNQAERDRKATEERWLADLRQYKGVYDPEVLKLIGARRSKSFVRKTRVKVKTVDSRVADLLFPVGAEKNWTIEPTPKPSVSPEHQAMVVQKLQDLQAAQVQAALQQQMMAMAQEAEAAVQQGADPQQVQQQMQQAQAQLMQQAQAQGQGPAIPRAVVDEAVQQFAAQASKKMAKVIEDQLVEARYKEVCLQAIHSCHLFGTGIVKGPLVERRVRTRFVMEQGKWAAKSEAYVVPFLDFVPLWRFYPDMGVSRLEDCRYVWERHLMVGADLAALAERKSFRGQVIKDYLKAHPRGEVRTNYVDNELKSLGDRQANQGKAEGLYEVLERWGWLSGQDLRQVGVDVPEDRCHESFFSNVWTLPDGQVIKAVLQPINGVTWPYHMYSFDKDETSLFAEGLSSIMRDDQTMINASVRMMLDNMALSAGSMFEVNPRLLTNMEKLDEVFPFKVWLRNGEQPGAPAVRPVDFSSHLGDLSTMTQMFENNADEVTAIPRYMTGENVAQGAAGTAAGMSMLMGAANIVIKDLIAAWDEGVTRPFLTALYRWNMQFNPDPEIKGDFDVKARGAASLVAKEVRSRQVNEFSMSVANELDAPYIKRDKLLRQRAEASELADVVKTDDEVAQEQRGPAAMQQQLAQQMQQAQLMLAQAQAAEAAAKAEKTRAEVARVQAEEALARAREIDYKVSSVYAALQAGGVAASNPSIAPAGDEILRSAGWQDDTPDPRIAELLSQQVQGAQGEQGGFSAQQMSPQAMQADQPQAADPGQIPDLQPMTGHAGREQGVETERING